MTTESYALPPNSAPIQRRFKVTQEKANHRLVIAGFTNPPDPAWLNPARYYNGRTQVISRLIECVRTLGVALDPMHPEINERLLRHVRTGIYETLLNPTLRPDYGNGRDDTPQLRAKEWKASKPEYHFVEWSKWEAEYRGKLMSVINHLMYAHINAMDVHPKLVRRIYKITQSMGDVYNSAGDHKVLNVTEQLSVYPDCLDTTYINDKKGVNTRRQEREAWHKSHILLTD